MGRKRSKARANWPDNLYATKEGGYRYRSPVTKKYKQLGSDKAAAFAKAKKYNAELFLEVQAKADADEARSIRGLDKTIADAIGVYRADVVPDRDWAARTLLDYGTYLPNRIERDIGKRAVATFTVQDCAEYLRTAKGARGRNELRKVLSWVLACAVQEGWAPTNVALQTIKLRAKRQRERLTIELYRAIHAKAEPWLQNAMDLSLTTLLRRGDVVALRFEDHHDSALWVAPQKNRDSTDVHLKIALDAEGTALVARCRDRVVSPFLVHRLPKKARPSNMRAAERVHHTQVLANQLSRAFADVRDQVFAEQGVVCEHPPTFHEIRSLGGALLRTEAGWTRAQVQALMGHATEAMTKVYLAGHEQPWTEVTMGLDVQRILGK